jgi:hypothetical protein
MNSRLLFYELNDQELRKKVKEWWAEADPEDGDLVLSPDYKVVGDFVFLFGHQDKSGVSDGSYLGKASVDNSKHIFFPLVNGRFGKKERGVGESLKDKSDGQYARIIRKGKSGSYDMIVIGQKDRKTSTIGDDPEYYYFGDWVCIEAQSLENGDIIEFGGFGGLTNEDIPFRTSARWIIQK